MEAPTSLRCAALMKPSASGDKLALTATFDGNDFSDKDHISTNVYWREKLAD